MSAGETFGYTRQPLPLQQPTTKRLVDVFGAVLAILIFAPLMLMVAIAIRVESRGPMLYKQERYGRGRRTFNIYKFRTMRHEAVVEFRQATRDDQRITRVGKILRRVNLDELPQLFNVLIGDMSLVGPRPHALELDDRFAPLIENFWHRYDMRPGITGWAQVKGYRGETDTIEKMKGRVDHDLAYIERHSFWFDIRILFMTVVSATAYRNAF
jgi:exopolysaccharide biosynthesis polyprenyl glycosylphosphotransferase